MKTWGLGVLAGAAGALLLAFESLPRLRNPENPISRHVESFYISRAIEDTATPNLVTAILADYRGYDTFGETTVIFAAGLSCYLLLRGSRG